MIDQRRKEIYKEVDESIKIVRKRESSDSMFSIFGKKKKERIKPKPEFNEEEVKEERIKELSQENEAAEDLKEEINEERPGFLSFMTNIFKKKEGKEETDMSEEESGEAVKVELYKAQMEGDARKALIIADSLIKKIPNFELRKFMQSKEYEVYESVMRKYKLR